MSEFIHTNTNDDGIDRRGFLRCMAWASTGVIWSVNGGILTSKALGQVENNTTQSATAELTFVQISDSHIGFNKPANTDVVETTRAAIMRVNALPKAPDFLLHTGDLTHLTEPSEFDTLAQLMKECRIKDVFYVPGEHGFFDNGEQYRKRFGKNTIGAGWYRESWRRGDRPPRSFPRTRDLRPPDSLRSNYECPNTDADRYRRRQRLQPLGAHRHRRFQAWEDLVAQRRMVHWRN
jgi:hypothetical protein